MKGCRQTRVSDRHIRLDLVVLERESMEFEARTGAEALATAARAASAPTRTSMTKMG
jgi:hypothetical protein